MNKLYEGMTNLGQYLGRNIFKTIIHVRESHYNRKYRKLEKFFFNNDFCLGFEVSDEGVSITGDRGLLDKIEKVKRKSDFYKEKKRSLQNDN